MELLDAIMIFGTGFAVGIAVAMCSNDCYLLKKWVEKLENESEEK